MTTKKKLALHSGRLIDAVSIPVNSRNHWAQWTCTEFELHQSRG